MLLKMRWIDANHLEVSYREANLGFQAVRCAGIEISVEELN